MYTTYNLAARQHISTSIRQVTQFGFQYIKGFPQATEIFKKNGIQPLSNQEFLYKADYNKRVESLYKDGWQLSTTINYPKDFSAVKGNLKYVTEEGWTVPVELPSWTYEGGYVIHKEQYQENYLATVFVREKPGLFARVLRYFGK